jgi:hypothetical protein
MFGIRQPGRESIEIGGGGREGKADGDEAKIFGLVDERR